VNVTKDYVFPPAGAYYAVYAACEADVSESVEPLYSARTFNELAGNGGLRRHEHCSHVDRGPLNPAVYIPGSCVLNGVTTNPCSTLGNIQLRRVLNLTNSREGQYYGAISGLDDGGTGNYHGLLLSVQRRAAKGLTVSANYTWSHCIADPVKTSQTATEYVIPGDRSSSRGNCGSEPAASFQFFRGVSNTGILEWNVEDVVQ